MLKGGRQPLAGKPPVKPVKDGLAVFGSVLVRRTLKASPSLAMEDLQVVLRPSSHSERGAPY